MPYDFDTVVDRRNTNSLKHDRAASRGKPAGLLPLWVADMDFSTAPCVVAALEDRVRHGIFGYTEPGDEYFNVLRDWFARRFGWEIQLEWLVKPPGVVPAINLAVKAFTSPGDGVLVQQPVYYPFSAAVTGNGRRLVVNELALTDGAYTIDFEDFERKIQDENVKLFILCSPHNPLGRVWTKAELARLGDICLKHGVLVVSDEIHADIVYPGHTHHVFAKVRPAFADITITCTSPGKAFNVAGLQLANVFIANEALRQAFLHEFAAAGFSQAGVMGLTACEAAYKDGEDWLEALKAYLYGNVEYVRAFLRDELPAVRLIEPEGTYLVWLDFRGLGLSDKALDDFILHKAKLWLSDGPVFGAGGAGFQRINIGCSRMVLADALGRLKGAMGEMS